jgi:titin
MMRRLFCFFVFLLVFSVCGATDLTINLDGTELELISIVSGTVHRTEEGDSIKVSLPFYVGKYPVTQGFYQAVMGQNPSHFKECGLDCPVENVSWDDIVEENGFLDTLNAMTGCQGLSGSGENRYKPEGFPAGCFRLPTVEELEYAHRAGSSDFFQWGNSDAFTTVSSYAWYGDNIMYDGSGTQPVGQKMPNLWGLYDTSGNVWEWTYTAVGSHSKIRIGGGWHYHADALRPSRRNNSLSDFSGNHIGFRLIRTAVAWSFATDDPINSAPVIDDDIIYVGSDDGILYAVDKVNGTEEWTSDTGSPISSLTVAIDGTIYVSNEDGELHAVDSDGNPLWESEVCTSISSGPSLEPDGKISVTCSEDNTVHVFNPDGSESTSYPAPVVPEPPVIGPDGTIYELRPDGRLYAVDPDDGTDKWSFKPDGEITSGPVVGDDGIIYVGSDDNKLYAIDPEDGSQEWAFATGDDITADPAVDSDGNLYVGSNDNNLYAISTAQSSGFSGLDIMAGFQWATVSWNQVDGASDYRLYYKSSPVVTPADYEFSVDIAGTAESETVYSLTNGVPWYFRVEARNAEGAFLLSSEISATPLSAAEPSLISASSEQAVIEWETVTGATGYVVYYKTSAGVTDTDASVSVSGGDSVSGTISGLTDGSEYYFRVQAVNNRAKSLLSATELSATPLPAPTLSTIQAGDTEAEISWLSVAGATEYRIYYNTSSGVTEDDSYFSFSGAANSGIVTGLSNGTEYYFRVQSRNDNNGASLSAAELSATPLDAPVLSAILAGNAEISVNWENAVAGATDYLIYYSTTSPVTTGDISVEISGGDSVTGIISSGLSNGTTWYLRVSAINAQAESPLSNELSAIPLATPSGLNLNVGNAQVSLSWNTVAGATGYVIYYSSDSGVDNSDSVETVTGGENTESVISGLENGSPYYFRVQAINDNAESDLCAEESATPLATPQNVSATAANVQATVSWTQVSGATSYRIYYSTVSPVTTAATSESAGAGDSSLTITGLGNDTKYYFCVQAVNSDGGGNLSTEVSARPIATPTPVGAESGNGSIDLSWGSSAGATLYRIYYSSDSGVDSSDEYIDIVAPAGSHTVTGLDNGISYYFLVEARNDDNGAAMSTEFSASPLGVPQNPAARAGSSEVQISWSEVSGADGYAVYYKSSSGVTDTDPDETVSGGDTTSLTISGLTNGTTYYFCVQATGTGGVAGGAGDLSAEVSATPLAVPEISAASASHRQITVQWDSSIAGATGYRIYRRMASGVTKESPYTTISDGGVTNGTISSLTNATKYYLRLSAINSNGESDLSTPEYSATPIAAPVLLSAYAGNASVTINWGTPVPGASRYHIYYKDSTGVGLGDNHISIENGSATEGTVTALSNGTKYYFRVEALNDNEGSSLSAEELSATPLSAPVLSQVTAGNSQVFIDWGSAVTGASEYRIYYSTSAAVSSADSYITVSGGDSTDSTITSLADGNSPANGTTYYFRVQAVNTNSASDLSSEELSAFLLTAPAISGVTGGNASALVTWTAPVDGADEYRIYYKSSSGVTVDDDSVLVSDATTTAGMVTGLSNGSLYYFRVQSLNPSGGSPLSNELSVTPLSTPALITVTGGSDQALLSWSAAITGADEYRIYHKTSAGVTEADDFVTIAGPNSTEGAVTGLSNGITHYFRLRAVNTNAFSDLSAAELSVIPLAVPELSAVFSGNGEVQVSWSSAVTGATEYRIYYKTGAGVSETDPYITIADSSATTGAVTGLSNGSSYYFRVQALNSDSASDLSSAELSATPLSAPDNISLSAANALVEVSWTAIDGASAYRIYYKSSSGVTDSDNFITVSGTNSGTVTGLSNGTDYYFRVQAVNAAGESELSATEPSATPLATVQLSSVTGGNTQAQLVWQKVTGATAYRIHYSSSANVTTGSDYTEINGSASTTGTVTGLANGTEYYFRVRAVNSEGAGDLSETELSAMPLDTPVISGISGSSSQAVINWEIVSGAEEYRIYYRNTPGVTTSNNYKQVSGGAVNTYTFTGLYSGTTYYFRVQARNSSSISDLSGEESATPLSPPELIEVNGGNAWATVIWASPVIGADSYRIYHRNSPGVISTDSYSLITGTNIISGTATGLTNGILNYLRVQALNQHSVSELSSLELSVVPLDTPSLSAVIAGDSSASIHWENAIAGADEYRIYYDSSPGVTIYNSHVTVSDSGADSGTVSGLTNGTTYYFRIMARNSKAESDLSEEDFAVSIDAPVIADVSAGNSSAFLSWVAISGATGYRVYYNSSPGITEAGTYESVSGSDSTSLTLSGLSNGIPYYFRVQAVNDKAESPLSTEETATPLATPIVLALSAGSGQTVLSWQAVSGADSYSIYYDTSPDITTAQAHISVSGADSTSGTVTGLVNGSTYYFRLQALNSRAESELSAEYSAVPLDTPQFASLLGQDGQVEISWDFITGADNYYIYYENSLPVSSESSRLTISGFEKSTSITGLTNGITWYYRLQAAGDNGESELSDTESATPLDTPALTQALAGNSRVTLNWASPVSGADNYRVYYSTFAGVSTADDYVTISGGDSTGADITALDNGTLYYFRVQAVAHNGESDLSVTELSAMPQSTPVISSVLAGNASVLVSWSEPSTGATSYRIYYKTQAGVTDSDPYITIDGNNNTSGLVSELVNGTTYYFRVQAVNESGSSELSVAELSAIPLSTPVLTIVSGADAEALVEWQTVAGADSYRIYYKDSAAVENSDSFVTVTGGSSTQGSVTGLVRGIIYYFRVQAVNEAGESELSVDELAAIPLAAPVIVSVSGGNSLASVKWSAPVTGADSYRIYYSDSDSIDGSGPSVLISGGDSTEGELTGLDNGTKLYFRVQAVNVVLNSAGALSETLSVTPLAPPVLSSVTGGSASALISWTESVTGAASYRIYYKKNTGGVTETDNYLSVSGGENTSAEINTLLNGNPYYFRVQALNSNSSSPLSTAELSVIPLAAPNLITAYGGSSQAKLSWERAINGADEYRIYYSSSAGVTTADNHVTVSGVDNSGIVPSLVNGVLYYFRAQAINSNAESELSAEKSAMPLDKVTGLSIASASRTITVSWDAVPGAEEYRVYYRESPGVNNSDSFVSASEGTLTVTLTELTNGQAYYFRVEAGRSNSAAELSAEINATPLSSETDVTIWASTQKATLYWSPIAGAQEYRIYYNNSPGVTNANTYITVSGGSNTEGVVENLSNDIPYYFRLEPRNAGGAGELSDELSAVPLSIPVQLSPQVLNDAVNVRWSEVEAAEGYRIYYDNSPGVTNRDNYYIAPEPQLNFTAISGLNNGVEYYFRLSALNENAESELSNELVAIPLAAPSGIELAGGSGKVNVSWGEVSGAANYRVYYKNSSGVDGNNDYISVSGSDSTSGLVSGLQNDQAWYFRVMALNDHGESVLSDERLAVPLSIPDDLSITGGSGSVQVCWSSVSGANGYRVHYKSSAGVTEADNHVAVSGRDNTCYTATGIDNGSPYYFRIAAINTYSISSLSAETSAIPMAAQSDLSAQAGNAQVVLNWTAIEGAESYRIYSKISSGITTDDSYLLLSNGASNSYDYQNLNNGQKYYFRVQSLNESGMGELSNEVFATPLDTPVITDRNAGNGEVQITWNQVTSATGYRVYYSDSSEVDSSATYMTVLGGSNNSGTISGLNNATTYYFKVQARNDGGSSDLSDAVSATPLDTPTGLNIATAHTQATISWQQVSAATSYRVYYKNSAGVTTSNNHITISGGENLSGTITELLNGTTYYFRVQAGNDGGVSELSAEISGTPLSRPLAVNVSGGTSQAEMAWAKVTAAESYRIYYSDYPGVTIFNDFAEISGGGNISHVFTGLTNGIPYYFGLQARNDTGASELSGEVSAIPLAVPEALSVVAGNSQATISWTTVAGADFYRIYYRETPGVNEVSLSVDIEGGDSSSGTVTGLKNGTVYYMKVQARNSNGRSSLSNELSSPTPLGTPTGISATGGNALANVSWQAVSGATEYHIYYSPSSGVTLFDNRVSVSGAAAVSGTVSSLTNGTTWYFRVQAANDGGEGDLSAEVSATPLGTPVITVAEGGDKQISVDWNPVSAASAYRLRYRLQGTMDWTEIVWLSTRPRIITGLADGSVYELQAQARNATTEGDWSNSEFSTPTIPATPEDFTLTGGLQEIVASWTESAGAYRYKLRYRESGSGVWSNYTAWIDEIPFTITGLEHGSSYDVALISGNDSGDSVWSATITTSTLLSGPEDLTVNARYKRIALSWSAVEAATGYQLSHRLSPAGEWAYEDWVSTTESDIVTGITAETTYDLRVRARKNNVESAFSETITTFVWADPETVLIQAGEVNCTTENCGNGTDVLLVENNFRMAVYELTQGFWEAVMGDSNWPGTAPGENYGRGDNHPMYYVSWNDIVLENGFLDKLNEAVGCTAVLTRAAGADRYNPEGFPVGCYRLPTADESEYANRAGTGTRYYWGDGETLADIDPYAWYSGNRTSSNYPGNYPDGTKPVGLKTANDWGLYDMSGNLWEWTYTLHTWGGRRVFKGGDWGNEPASLTPAYPGNDDPYDTFSSLGFRLVLEVAQPPAVPANVEATPANAEVNLNWTESNGATSYKIYYSSSAGVTTTNDSIEITAPATSGTITGLTNGVAWYFRISALNENGESRLSAEVSATPLPPIEMVAITAGSVNCTSEDCGNGESTLTVYNDYKIGKYEVTQGLWEAVMGAGAWPGNAPSSTYGVGDDYPMYNVSWDDIIQENGFLDKLNEAIGCTAVTTRTAGADRYDPTDFPEGCYRLPTADESEFAHRAGSETYHYWGDGEALADIDPYVWYSSNSGSKTHPVGGKLPNSWDLYDMSGNVWEWAYDLIYGSDRVIRGGGWDGPAGDLRSANRYSDHAPINRPNAIGFRLVLELTQPIPAAPTDLTATPGNAEVELDWTRTTYATSYNIYYATSAGVTTASSSVSIDGGDSTTAAITGLTNGTTYYFAISAVNNTGESDLSAEVTATPLPHMDMIEITAGSVLRAAEGTTLTVYNDFKIGKYEVTQGLWEAIMGAGAWPGTAPSSTYGVGDDYSMYYVSWDDIIQENGFLDKLNEAIGCTAVTIRAAGATRYDPADFPEGCYRLPTADESEFAHRAGSETRHYWGDGEAFADIDPYAWFIGNTGNKTHPVGEKLPNDWDLYDMSGNVSEWTYTQSGSYRVLRGGSWADLDGLLRSASRYGYNPGNRSIFIGFRLVFEVTQPIPAAPTGLVADPQAGEVELSWDRTTYANSYNIYYADSAGVTTASSSVSIDGGDSTTAAITGLTNGTTYYFAISAVNNSGESDLSSEVTATPLPHMDMVAITAGTVNCTTENCGNGTTSITIGHDYKIGKYEVTQSLWEAVMGNNPSYFSSCGDDCPVEQVSWNSIVLENGFLDSLNEAIGCTAVFEREPGVVRYNPIDFPDGCYRLPTADEFEYANRAGTETKYNWGDSDDVAGLYAWYFSNSGSKTQPVGKKLPNALGLYDMSGNVWEWTYTRYAGSSYYFSSGGWSHSTSYLRSAYRAYSISGSGGVYYAQYGYMRIGFRLLLSTAQPIPATPTSLTAEPQAGEVELSWDRTTYANSYNIYYADSAGVTTASSSVSIDGGDSTTAAITGLTNGTTYYFAISAVNNSGESDLSAEVTATPLPHMDMIEITAGTVNCTTEDCGNGETSLTIYNDFKIGKYEVTQGLWEAVMGAGAWPETAPSEDYGVGDDYPMYYVSWDDIIQENGFLDKLNEAIGCTAVTTRTAGADRYDPTDFPEGCYRLPTADESEFAHRAGSETRHYWGDGEALADIDPYAWYYYNSYNLGSGDPDYGTQPVGGKLPNSWDLYDMSGNVWEWTHTQSGSYRVNRGGGWSSNASNLRSASRDYNTPPIRFNYLGFRLVFEVTQPIPAAPTSLTADPQAGEVELSWDRTTYANSYNIYYADSAGVTTASSSVSIDGGDSTTAAITGLTNGTTYYFAISAVNNSGESDLSAEVTATPLPHMDMIEITAGSVLRAAEGTTLTVYNDYKIGKYEVTQGLWEAIMGAGAWPGTAPSSTYGVGDDYPMYYVSWDDIIQENGFLDKLNEAIGCTAVTTRTAGADRYDPTDFPEGCYRLPTADESEYAHRAGSETYHYWGDGEALADIDPYAWYYDNSYNLGSSHPDYGTQPVGGKLPNDWGLYDVSGNVWEWTYTQLGSLRVRRGGGWRDNAGVLRSADRLNYAPAGRSYGLGFRLVFEVTQPIPATPTELVAEPQAGEVELSWATSTYATSYNLYYSDSAGVTTASSSISIDGGDSTTGVVTGLTNGTTYYFAISAVNNSGESELSSEVTATPLPHMDMVAITAGTVNCTTENCGNGETTLTVNNDYKIGKYEVTQSLWEAIMGAGSWPGTAPSATYGVGDDYPTYYVSWDDITKADGFLDKLNETIGCTAVTTRTAGATRYDPADFPEGCYRLPTADESEYAHRADTETRHYWGESDEESIVKQYAWYRNNAHSSYWTEPHADNNGTQPVGGKLPNAWDLYDMSGNVWEWTYTPSGSSRVIHGGCWSDDAGYLRSARRRSLIPDYRYFSLGFRLLLSVRQPVPATPTELTAEPKAGEVELSWATSTYATSYNLYYSDSAGVTTASSSISIDGGDSTTGLVTGLTNGTTYYFAISAVNNSGESELSAEISATPLPHMDMVAITAGSVYRTAEGTTLTVNNDYKIGKYEVTQGLWEAVMGNNPSYFSSCGDDCPVEGVSWDDIVLENGFLDKLNVAIGCTAVTTRTAGPTRYDPADFPEGCYRLPTADESEYAHRAGSETYHHWGDGEAFADVDPYAWYSSNSSSKTHPVGEKLSNTWDLYDMNGNVSEWTYDLLYGSDRGFRGGSWADGVARSATRSDFYSVFRDDFIGFRLLLSVRQPVPATPTELVAEPQAGEVELSWATSTYATSYNLYYSDSAGVTTASSSISIDGGDSTTGLVTGLTNGTTYYFAISAVNNSGESELSAEISATPLPHMDMVAITAGSVFRTAEGTTLTVNNDYKIGKYEVTQGLWEAVMGAGSWPGTAPSATYGVGDDYPMYYVSWNDIIGSNGFLDKLNETIGCTAVTTRAAGATRYDPADFPEGCYRLPTADESEYAHRAGTEGRHYWGESDALAEVGQYAWYGAYSGGNSGGKTHPVGEKLSNSWDLYDMSGNVWEWTYTRSALSGDCVVRGGSWRYTDYLRSAYRDYVMSSNRTPYFGFRLLLSVRQPVPAAPTELVAEPQAGEVELSWATSTYATSYNLYYSDSAGVTTASSSISIDGGDSTTGLVTGLTNGTTYYFAISAVNNSGESDLSAEISATPLPHMDMVAITAGSVYRTAEGTTLTVNNDYKIGKYEVTQGLWEAVMGAGSWPGTAPSATYGVGDDYPMYYVSWDDITKADGFLDKLNEAIGCTAVTTRAAGATRYDPADFPEGCYRLPTADESEYAHRAGSETYHYWGDGEDEATVKQYAWYRYNARSSYWTEPHADNSGTQPVGLKTANSWDLYDMSGNVWEWTYTSSGSNRVIRGGSWSDDAGYLRSAYRGNSYPGSGSYSLGFRVLFSPVMDE